MRVLVSWPNKTHDMTWNIDSCIFETCLLAFIDFWSVKTPLSLYLRKENIPLMVYPWKRHLKKVRELYLPYLHIACLYLGHKKISSCKHLRETPSWQKIEEPFWSWQFSNRSHLYSVGGIERKKTRHLNYKRENQRKSPLIFYRLKFSQMY